MFQKGLLIVEGNIDDKIWFMLSWLLPLTVNSKNPPAFTLQWTRHNNPFFYEEPAQITSLLIISTG